MIDLESLLLVVAANPLQPSESRFLLTRRPEGTLSLPGALVTNSTCFRQACESFREALGFDPDRFQGGLSLLHFADDENRFSTTRRGRAASVVHGCLIPEPVHVNIPLEWRTFAEVTAARPLFGDHFDILLRGARKLGRAF